MPKKVLISGIYLLVSVFCFNSEFSFAQEKSQVAIVDTFDKADSDRDGYINLEEAQEHNLFSEDKFYEADIDSDNWLSLSEVKQVLSTAKPEAGEKKEAVKPIEENTELSMPEKAPEQVEEITPPKSGTKPVDKGLNQAEERKKTIQRLRNRPYRSQRSLPSGKAKRHRKVLPPDAMVNPEASQPIENK